MKDTRLIVERLAEIGGVLALAGAVSLVVGKYMAALVFLVAADLFGVTAIALGLLVLIARSKDGTP